MRLTWKDVVATLFTAAIVAVYIAFLQSAGWPLLGSVRGTTAVMMVLGTLGGCAFGAAGELYGRNARATEREYVTFTSIVGLIALGAGIYALVTANGTALAVLFIATMGLWLAATARHLFSLPTTPATPSRDVHEAIHPHSVTPK